MDNKNDEIDYALCTLNEEILEMKRSREYQLGLKMLKLFYSVSHLQFRSLWLALEHAKVDKKLERDFKKNEEFITYDKTITTNKKISVYTCITGNYDDLIEPLYVPDNVDFYVITDMTISDNSAWKKIDINTILEIQKMDNTRKARYAKTHPHVFFPEYEYSIWVDSNFRVIGNLSKFINYVGPKVPFASNWHPTRKCIYSEVKACIIRKKDDPSLLLSQIENYQNEGMPIDFGLIETNFIVRRHNDKNCIRLMEAWWVEIVHWSKRDQISLPYVIWKQGYTMKDLGFIGTEIRNNPNVQVILHAVDYRCPTK